MPTSTLGLKNDYSDGDDLYSADVNAAANAIEAVAVDRTLAWGELYEDNPSGTGITVTTAGTYYGWITAMAGQVRGAGYVTADTTQASGDRLTVGASAPGTYAVLARLSIKGPNSANLTVAVHKNGTIQPNLKGYLEMPATAKAASVVLSGLLALVNGDYLDVRVTSGTNGDVVTIYETSLVVRRIGP